MASDYLICEAHEGKSMTGIENYRMFATVLLALTVAFTATTTSAHAQYSVLYKFGFVSEGPGNPVGAVAQGLDGSLYSTSSAGGTYNNGTVFKITPAGQMHVLHNFCPQLLCADGSQPEGGLTLRPDGHFIGTTSAGGSHNSGTIFDISPDGSLTTLYTFTSGADGGSPYAPPILGPDGQFYGVTESGGAASNCGTIYRLSTVFTVLHSFNKTGGCTPVGPLVLGTDGNLYGTTIAGGTKGGWGTIYRLTYRPGQSTLFTVLDNFDGTTLASPEAQLTEGSDGNFYGTTTGGGTSGKGVIFKITPSGNLTVLHDLNGTTDGSGLLTGMAQGTDGNFYGTATFGANDSVNCAPQGCGTLFLITPAGSFSILYTFDFTTGNAPDSTPFQHTNGLFYGDTARGASQECGSNFGCGVFYSWNSNLMPFVSTVQLMGAVGSTVEILGQGFTSSSTVSFNGVAATTTVQSGTSLWATVPTGATTGFVTVTTSTGTLTSNRQFVVTQ
jgi:uncharacterized repeat protein (TIGR03803 family)